MQSNDTGKSLVTRQDLSRCTPTWGAEHELVHTGGPVVALLPDGGRVMACELRIPTWKPSLAASSTMAKVKMMLSGMGPPNSATFRSKDIPWKTTKQQNTAPRVDVTYLVTSKQTQNVSDQLLDAFPSLLHHGEVAHIVRKGGLSRYDTRITACRSLPVFFHRCAAKCCLKKSFKVQSTDLQPTLQFDVFN